jgi:hypothetical protein
VTANGSCASAPRAARSTSASTPTILARSSTCRRRRERAAREITVLATSAGKLSTRAISRAAGYRIELTADWPTALARWNAVDPSTPFQHAQWHAAWYGAFAGQVEPLIAVITDAVTGEQAALLPLIRRRQNGIRIVEFADLDLTDYNAPLLGPAAPRDARAARTLWRNLRARCAACPAAPISSACASSPSISTAGPTRLRLLDDAGPCSLNGNLVTTGEITSPGATRWKRPCARNWSGAGACSPAMPPQPSSSPRIMMKR